MIRNTESKALTFNTWTKIMIKCFNYFLLDNDWPYKATVLLDSDWPYKATFLLDNDWPYKRGTTVVINPESIK
jgi:hypothetical protein